MITILIGKSAAGKDFYQRKLIKEKGMKPIITCTTRPMREREKEGVDYFFLSEKEFLRRTKTGEIFEYRAYNTIYNGIPSVWYYGSPKLSIENIKTTEYVTIVDVDGALSYIKNYDKNDLNVIFIIADDVIRMDRAKKRGSFSSEEWERRVKDDEIKFGITRINEIEKALGKKVTILDNSSLEEPFKKIQ